MVKIPPSQICITLVVSLTMKKCSLIIFSLFIHTILFGQERNLVFSKFKFQGNEFSLAKADVIKAFGQPKIVDPNYECGFYSNDQPGQPYYQLTYSYFNYIGSDKENFILESLDFDSKGKVILLYGDKILTGLTTKSEFAKIFGEDARTHFEKHPDKVELILFAKDSDDGVLFTFKNGRLIKFEYWSPC